LGAEDHVGKEPMSDLTLE